MNIVNLPIGAFIGLMAALMILIGVMGVGVFLWGLKQRYAKEAHNAVLAEVITKAGGSFKAVIKPRHGCLEVPMDNGNPGRIFAIADIATYEADYPEGGLSLLQTKVRKAIFHEEVVEPISNVEPTPVMTPEMIYNLVNQQVTELAVIISNQIKDVLDRAGALNPIWVYALLIVAAGAAGASAYFGFQIMDGIEILKAGAGL